MRRRARLSQGAKDPCPNMWARTVLVVHRASPLLRGAPVERCKGVSPFSWAVPSQRPVPTLRGAPTRHHPENKPLFSYFVVPSASGHERLPQSMEMEVRLRATGLSGVRLARKDDGWHPRNPSTSTLEVGLLNPDLRIRARSLDWRHPVVLPVIDGGVGPPTRFSTPAAA